MLVVAGCRRGAAVGGPEAQYRAVEGEFLAGELSQAERDAAQGYQRFGEEQPLWGGRFRLEWAKVLIYEGKNGEALPLLEQAPPVALGVEAEVRRLTLLTIAEVRLGHVAEAEAALAAAEKECPAGPLRAEVESTKGSLAIETGDLDEAELWFQKALVGARAQGNEVLQTYTLMNLGVVALQEEHYDDALARFGEASKLARKLGANLVLEKSLGNVGWVYYKLGDFERAVTNLDASRQQGALLGSAIDQVRSLNNLGLCEYRLGDVGAARRYYEQSLALAEGMQNQEEMLDAHVNLGFLLLRAKDVAGAAGQVREAKRIAAVRKNRRAMLEPMLVDALLRRAQGDEGGARSELLELERVAGEVPSLRWEAESALAHGYAGSGRNGDADVWFRRSIGTFQGARSKLQQVESTLPFLENGSDLYTGYAEFLIGQGRTAAALQVVDESRAEALADGLHMGAGQERDHSMANARMGVEERGIAARLKATVLVYLLRPGESYVWVIRKDKEAFYRLAGSERILPLIDAQRRAILASKDLLAQRDSAGGALYDLLVKPAAAALGQETRLFLVGDAGLDRLNFETLIHDGHYWIEDVQITNAKSLRLLAAQGERRVRVGEGRMLLIGNPVYRLDQYGELPQAGEEMAKVAGHFDGGHRTVLEGAAASPEAYKASQPGGYAYVHFVAHATASENSPLDSAVVLSQDANDAAQYKLYAREILRQKLNAELVTLSACYGSGEREYLGEGLVGLAWAFLRAGSHEVIGAMWEVSDASTPELMDQMYGELEQGKRADAALRDAKLAMLQTSGVFRKPLYWAPFQLYAGD